MTERSIRLTSWERQGSGAIGRPGGQRIPWPPRDERLAEDLRRALATAQDEAARLGHNHVGPLHLLVGLIAERDGLAARTLNDLGITLERAREALKSTIGRGDAPFAAEDITVTPRTQRVIDVARFESRRLAHPRAASEHLLLALLYEKEDFTMRLLEALRIDPDEVRARTLARLRVPASYRVAQDADLSEGPYERFDEASRQVLAFAREEATRLGHHWIGGEHVVLGLARAAQNAASESALRQVFAQFGITVERLREEVVKIQPARAARAATTDFKFNLNVKLIIELAINEAGAGSVVRPEHILAAVGASEDSIALYVLKQFGVSPSDLRSARGSSPP